MRYDRHGFPIPAEFERPTAAEDAADFGRVGPRLASLEQDDDAQPQRRRPGQNRGGAVMTATAAAPDGRRGRGD